MQAKVVTLIPTSEQKYVDPKRRYAHNALYPATVVEVVEVKGDRALLKDETGEFWVSRQKLRIEE